jgi:hypothetical protein
MILGKAAVDILVSYVSEIIPKQPLCLFHISVITLEINLIIIDYVIIFVCVEIVYKRLRS